MRVDKCPNCGMGLVQRSGEQNSGIHAVFSELARVKDWPNGSGQMLDAETWKRLLIAAFERTQGRGPGMYPALDGNGFEFVHKRSSRMSKREMSEFIEFVNAWCADQDLNVGLGVAA